MRLLTIILSFLYVGCFGQMTMNARHFTSKLDTATTASSSTLLTGLVELWELDESTGTTAAGEVGTYDLTNDGATVNQTGVVGSGTSYGLTTNDQVYSANNIMEYATFSVSVWFNTSIAGSTTAGIVSNTSGSQGWSVYVDGDWDYSEQCTFMINSFAEKISTANGGGNGVGEVNDGTWHHVVVTVTSGSRIMYLDGTQITSNTSTTAISYAGTNALNIGELDANYFPGNIDQVGVWNKILTSTEVTELYNSGDGSPYSTW